MAAIFVIALAMNATNLLASSCEQSQKLEGRWLATQEDSADHADPAYDDSKWRAMDATSAAVSRVEDGIQWYRLHFTAEALQDCALFLGRIQEVDEVWLNGELIGASGRMGRNWFDYVSAYRQTRAYSIPDGVLRDGENVLAVRILSFYLDSQIPVSTLMLGSRLDLTAKALESNLTAKRIETAVLAINLLGALLLAVTALSYSGSISHRWLSLVLLSLAAAYSIESLSLYELRLEYPWLKRLTFMIMAVIPLIYLKYHYALFGGYPQWSDSAVALIPAPLALLHQLNLPIGMIGLSYDLWHISFLPFGLLILYKLLRNSLAGLPDARMTLFAVLAPVAGFVLAVMDVNVMPGGVDPIEAGGLCMTLLLLINFALRYSRDHESLMRLSKGILEAQDQERRRIARELHDGLGQRMVATRLMLDALHMGNPNSQLEQPVAELREAVTELRTMVYGLRPASLEDHDLVTALRTYADRTTELTGTLVDVKAEDMAFDLPTHLEEHVFRIFQEAINNAIRHGLASTVEVSFACHVGHITLDIKDNGDGFKVSEREGAGVGLTAMAERARVCHGRLLVTSKPGEGTVVHAEIPHDGGVTAKTGKRAGDEF